MRSPLFARRFAGGALSALLAVSLLGGCSDDDKKTDDDQLPSAPQDEGG